MELFDSMQCFFHTSFTIKFIQNVPSVLSIKQLFYSLDLIFRLKDSVTHLSIHFILLIFITVYTKSLVLALTEHIIQDKTYKRTGNDNRGDRGRHRMFL